MYLKNGSAEKELYKRVESEPTLLQPLNALFNQPFEGSASYFEAKAQYADDSDTRVTFIPIYLNAALIGKSKSTGIKQDKARGNNEKKDPLEDEILGDLIRVSKKKKDGTRDTMMNFPLARWLSKTIIKQIQLQTFPLHQSKFVTELLEQIRKTNSINKPSEDAYKKLQNDEE